MMANLSRKSSIIWIILIILVLGLGASAVILWRGNAAGSSGGGTLLNVEPFEDIQIGMDATPELLSQFTESENVRGKTYVKPDTWEAGGKSYSIQVILGVDPQGRINMITLDFLYPQQLTQKDATALDLAIRDWFRSTFDPTIIKEVNRTSDWPGLLQAGGSNNVSLVYEYIPEMWLQMNYVPSS